MNSSLSTAIRQSSTMKLGGRLLRAIFNWRTARRTLIGCALVATLIATFFAVENWRGQRTWSRLEQELRTQGKLPVLASVIPPPIPDERNFAMAPFWKEISYGTQVSYSGAHWFEMRTKKALPSSGDWTASQPINLQLWQTYFAEARGQEGGLQFPLPETPGTPAEDVLLALTLFDEKLGQLRAAAARPDSRFPLHYQDNWNMILPHLSVISSAVAVLKIRSLAELELARTDAALADLKLLFRIGATIESEPAIISQLVRIATINSTLSVIWHGAAAHRWAGAQLLEIEAELSKLEYLSSYELSRRMEGVSALNILDEMREKRAPELARILSDRQEAAPSLSKKDFAFYYWIMPGGWFDFNKVAYIKQMDQTGSPRRNPSTASIDIRDWRQRCETIQSQTTAGPKDFLAAYLTLWQPAVSFRFIQAEAHARLALTACALERYYLENGSYPESLALLHSRVPTDIIDGAPLKYQSQDKHTFTLYSLGWNGTDDGGQLHLNPDNRRIDPKEGDWIWRYPSAPLH